jgi:hypothetical protein
VSPAVLDVDVGGCRRESSEESMGIVSIASGDSASGRGWDCEAGSGVEMVGVDVILVNFVELRGVGVEERVVVEYGVEGIDIEITWGSSITGRLKLPPPAVPNRRIGATWRGCNQRQRKRKSNTPHQLFVGHVSTNKNLETGEIPQLLLLYCTYSRTIRPVQSLVSILLLHNQSFV